MSDHALGVRLREILLPPLRHLLLSPAFLSELGRTPPLSEPRSRLRFLQELREVFATPLCERMEAVVEGLLGLPANDRTDGSALTDPTTATPVSAIPVPPPQRGEGAGPAALKAWPIALAGFLGGRCCSPWRGFCSGWPNATVRPSRARLHPCPAVARAGRSGLGGTKGLSRRPLPAPAPVRWRPHRRLSCPRGPAARARGRRPGGRDGCRAHGGVAVPGPLPPGLQRRPSSVQWRCC